MHTPEIYRGDFLFASDMFQSTKSTVLSFQLRHELLAGKGRENDATMSLERRAIGSGRTFQLGSARQSCSGRTDRRDMSSRGE